MDTDAEIEELKKRVSLLEATVSALARQVQSVQPELVSLREINNDRFDGVDIAIDKLQHRIERIDTQVWALRDDLPTLISDAVRKAVRPT